MRNIFKRFKLSSSAKIIIGFISLIILGSFLLCMPISNTDGKWLNYIDSIFTSTSAVCVTGLTVIDISTKFTLFGKIIILSLIQLGGLGIIAITSLIFLILGKKINLSSRIAIKESINKDSLQGVVKFIKKSIIITFIIESIGAILLLPSTISHFDNIGLGIFSAIFLAISAFCNAGFDILGKSGQEFLSLNNFSSNILMLLPIIFLIILGGIGFIVLLSNKNDFKTKQHIKLVLWISGILIFGGTILFLIFEWNNPNTLGNMSLGEKIINALFQSVTTRTAGFASINQANLTTGSRILTILLMFIGGSPNSTAGGLKTTTLFILLLFMFRSANENNDIEFKGKKISNKLLIKAVKVTLYTLFSLTLSICLISLFEPLIPLNSIIFECVSAISTVGLTMGITPHLAIGSKLILTILMFVGRIGLATIALTITSKQAKNTNIEYPNTDIIVG
ncbi:MAG: Trk family potassium uptake protein [Clostridia bacterium]|nr:Trk family potassium uptake protein [Clostridia bacterium]